MLVCFSHLRWGFVWQRPQHLMSRFARSMPVVFVEEAEVGGERPVLRIAQRDGVSVVTPVLPDGGGGFGPETNDSIRALLAPFIADHAPDPNRAVRWYLTPMALGAEPSDLAGSVVVFDAMDELANFRGAPAGLAERERALMARADLVFAGGPSLHRARKDRHRAVHCFPSGVDAAHFARGANGAGRLPGVTERPGPGLGFYGVIDERIDLGLIDAIAEARPGWTISMVGPVAKIDPAALPRRPNVAYLGKQDYHDLPAVLAGFDVGLLPFALNEAPRFISPTKTLEYLAGGKPIVSTPVADVAELYGEVVRFGGAPAEFIAAVEAVLDETPAERSRRETVARRILAAHEWDGIAERMRVLVARAVANRVPAAGVPAAQRPARGGDVGPDLSNDAPAALPVGHARRDGGSRPAFAPLEVWGGVEGTVNRVGDHSFDQMARNGLDHRLTNLDLFAGLGIRAIRYPVLWERIAPGRLEDADWRWPDERLPRLRNPGVRPIVGLVHHGSGPHDTDLLDPAFPERLASYAGAVAARYPWVQDWTPVNEPPTTALFGHWCPHARDDRSIARALLTQCRAVVLAMHAIRAVNPAARLVQTDDLGKTRATPAMAPQAAFENERRWVTGDLLTGRLTPDTTMRRWFRETGIPEDALAWFLANPCPPDVVGIDHSLSSERFLDERLHRYPEEAPGGHGHHRYVDVLAARVLPEGPAGPATPLAEAWGRFRLPLAITEAHDGCTREEQIPWLAEVWQGALAARPASADARAVTVWSLLGAHDWHTLVTGDEGGYEPGVFDARASPPRPTAIARMVRDLATRGRHDHPVLVVPGWCRRHDRFSHGPPPTPADASPSAIEGNARPVVIVGDEKLLVRTLVRACRDRGLPYRLAARADPARRDPEGAAALRRRRRAWAAIDARGGDGAPRDAAPLALAAGELGAALLAFSSNPTFDGSRSVPYLDSAPPTPGDRRWRRQADGVARILAAHPGALVVRSGHLFGGEAGAALAALDGWDGRDDAPCSPTYAPDLVDAALDLLIDGERGAMRLANDGTATIGEFRGRIRRLTAADDWEPAPAASRPEAQPAPERERGTFLPDLDDALARWLRTITPNGATPRQAEPGPALAPAQI